MVWVALCILLVCSGSVSGSETALFALTRKDLLDARKSGGTLSRRLYRVMQHPNRVLMTVLIANTAINTAIFSLSYLLVERVPDDQPEIAAAIGTGVLASVVVFGEMLPKAVALANARALAPISAVLIAILEFVLIPIHWILSNLVVNPIIRLVSPESRGTETVSTEELRLLVEHSAREGHFGATENEMLQAVVGMAEVSVREVMTPRVDIESVGIEDSPRVLRKTATATRRRVLPVRGRDLDDIRGIVYARKLLLFPEAMLSELLQPADFIPEQANLAQVSRHFREQSSQCKATAHMAIIVDEYGGTAGLVTNEDVVEWIVGDLPTSDEAGTTTVTERIDEDTYRVSADLGIAAWGDGLGIEEVDRRANTVGGLILARLGRLPRVGESVRIRNLRLTVESMQRHRIERVLIRRMRGHRPRIEDNAT